MCVYLLFAGKLLHSLTLIEFLKCLDVSFKFMRGDF